MVMTVSLCRPARSPPFGVLRIAGPQQPAYGDAGGVMAAPVVPRERDLRRLAGIVSEHRDDIPAEGVPLSLLKDLAGEIRCDSISFEGFDSRRGLAWFCNENAGARRDRQRRPQSGALAALLALRAVQLPGPDR